MIKFHQKLGLTLRKVAGELQLTYETLLNTIKHDSSHRLYPKTLWHHPTTLQLLQRINNLRHIVLRGVDK